MNDSFGWRSKFIWLILIALFSLISYKLCDLMLYQHDFLQQQGLIRSDRVKVQAVSRGPIYDRNNKVLAQSLPSGFVWVASKNFAKLVKYKKQLMQELAIDFAKINLNQRHIVLKKWLSPDQLAWLQQQHFDFLHVEKVDKRYYPWQESAASLLGLVDLTGAGNAGLELAFDQSLQSQQGKLVVEKNRKGQIVQIKNFLKNPQESKGLVLTIDADVQKLTYDALQAGIKKYGAESASAIVIQPDSGEIIALANAPGFNPNNTSQLDLARVKNKAVTDLFEPGSTIKPFTIAAAMAANKLAKDDKVETGDGKFEIYGHQIEDEFHKHGLLSITDILQKSSNVAISKIALRLKPEVLPQLLVQLGFTSPVLYLPGEAYGKIVLPAWRSGLEQVTLAFGYGISTSALQLAHAYSILANDGVDKGLYIKKQHKTLHKRIIDQDIASFIRQQLVHVTDLAGTAHAARIPKVDVAGKTGTSRIAGVHGYKSRKYVASFVGMFPAKRPKWLVLVVVNKPNLSYYFGGRSAAPIFSEIGQKLMQLLKLDRYLDPSVAED